MTARKGQFSARAVILRISSVLDSLPRPTAVKNDRNPGRPTLSFEELAYSNMLIVRALVELLSEEGLLGNADVMQRVKKLRRETRFTFPRNSERRLDGSADSKNTAVVVTAGDLISANMVIVETLLALFVDKGSVTQVELEELVVQLRAKAQGSIPRKQ